MIQSRSLTAPYDRRGSSRRKSGDPRSNVEVDHDRIVHSHAFRRLQRKTQIVGVQTHDFFRTRLTHSIECAQTGRAICGRLTDGSWEGVTEQRDELADLVEAACLAHDLGHPPFGHTGEEALDRVMRENAGVRFEANAQSFRIVTLLEPKKYNRLESPVKRPLGLDLTRATLVAMSKYPWTERDALTEVHGGKFGVYDNADDLESWSWVWEDSGSESPGRTLATEILEAADDIAYAVHDLEDGVWARLVPIDQIAHMQDWAVARVAAMAARQHPGMFATETEIVEELQAIFAPIETADWAERPFDRSRASEGGLKSFCSQMTDDLISAVTADGTLGWTANDALQRRIAVLKAIVWSWMIEQPELVTRRFGQRRIIADLFDGFLAEPGMLPYQDEWERVAERGDAERARLVCDHIASMTDQYAAYVHAEMTGTVLRWS